MNLMTVVTMRRMTKKKKKTMVVLSTKFSNVLRITSPSSN